MLTVDISTGKVAVLTFGEFVNGTNVGRTLAES